MARQDFSGSDPRRVRAVTVANEDCSSSFVLTREENGVYPFCTSSTTTYRYDRVSR
jgi:hypothetical protein